ncbi:porin, partial [Methylobacterium nigriterrae]|uniref:porin n=1 Tax=Methylobacterium nigriterrae TaxID=3127512 RepID=UPI003013F570
NTFGAASVRVDNMFRYLTPNFGGFQAGIGYAAEGAIIRDDVDPSENRDRSNYLALGLQYTNEKIHAAVTYDRVGGDTQYAPTSWAAFGSYD